MLPQNSLILEGIVTTQNADGSTNISPMGPIVDRAITRMRLRPFQTSTTYSNLKARGQGVFHVTDDVELFARAATGILDLPELRAAEKVPGMILADACRWYEFEVDSIDESNARAEIDARIVSGGKGRDFFGFNRAKHAAIEAAILATRVGITPADEILAELTRLAVPVEKTAGDEELRAFRLLEEYIREYIREKPKK